ncbi:MAG: STAS domain-containing protein [Ilumatobacteraceae bacterium]
MAGPENMEITRAGDGWAVTGELDARTAPALARAVSADPASSTVVHLDLSGVTFIDSSGLGVLVDLARQAAADGGSLRLDHPSTAVTRLLEITKLTETFGVG